MYKAIDKVVESANYQRINGSKIHQRIIGQLMMRLGMLYYLEKKIPFEPLPETMIDESQTSPTPDILLFDNENKLNRVIIEISGNTGARRDFEKIKTLMIDYNVSEGFVYNYDTKQWRKYLLDKGEDLLKPSFCEAIGYDLNALI